MKKHKITKRLLAFAMSLCMIFTMMPMSAHATTHEHDASCGYAPASECTHSHDGTCGYTEAVAGAACNHTHGDCSYIAASNGTPCGHSHDTNCGYVEAKPCSFTPCDHSTCGYVAESPCSRANCDHSSCGYDENDLDSYCPNLGCDHQPQDNCGYVEGVECPNAGQTCDHSTCGYTEGSPCNHTEHTDCGYSAPVEGVACDHSHNDSCGYKEAVEAKPCSHSHNANCGYSEGSPCTYVEPEHTHSLSGWGPDNGETHSKYCINCPENYKEQTEAHRFDYDCDASCDLCGYNRGERSHTYNISDYDDTHHWEECACGEEQNRAAHSYSGDTDTSCDCGYTRTIEHTHTWGDYISNGDGSHTRICTTDSSHRQSEDCGGTATCHELATCPGCGASHGEYNKNNHVGGTEIRNAVAAGEFTDGYTGDIYCKGCGDLLSKGESIPATHVHSYSIQYSDIHHWDECSCGDTSNLANHDGYQDDGNCDHCGSHVHVWHRLHNSDGTHTRTCKFDSSHVEIDTTDYSYYWNSDKTTHWKVCNLCGENNKNWEYHVYDGDSDPICNICGYRREDSTHEHRYVFATCVSPALCSCGMTTGEKNPHNHTGGTEIRNAIEATYETEGYTGDTYCLGCGVKLASGEPTDKLSHAHRYIFATCVSPALCSCGLTSGEKNPNNHTGGTEIRNAAEATIVAEGYTGDTYCLGCGSMIASGEVIPKAGVIFDGPGVKDVTFTPGEGLVLPEDAVLVVDPHTPSGDDLDFVLGIDADTEYLDADDVKIQIVGGGVYTAPDGTEYSMYEIIQINGEEYLITNYMGTGDVLGLMRLSDGATCGYKAAVNVLDFTGSINGTVQDYAYDKVNIGGVTYDVKLSYANAQGTIEVILYYNGSPAAKLRNYEDCYFLEGCNPEMLKAQQNVNDLGTVTPGESPIDGLEPGKTYNVSVIGSNDISVPGYDEAVLNSIKVETEAEKAAKAEVERLKADMEAKKAAVDQLDANDPDHMEAWAAWYEAEIAYEEALAELAALANLQSATVTQTFAVPEILVGNEKVVYAAVHKTANGNEIGEITLSEDGKTLTATYTVNSFSPFTVYAFTEADEPEIKTLSATVVDGSDDTTEAPDTSEPVVSPQTSDSWIWYVLIAVVAGAIAVASVVYGKRRKSKAN